MTNRLYYEPQDKTVLVRPPDHSDVDVPYGYIRIDNDFIHDKPGDALGWAGNHVLWHHIRDCLYPLGVMDMREITIRDIDDKEFPPLVPTDPLGPKLFQSDAPTKQFTTQITLGSRMALVEVAVLAYGKPSLTVTHGGQALQLLHSEHSPEDTIHIYMFRGEQLTPEDAPLVIKSTEDMLLMSGRMNEYPEYSKVGDYHTWHGQQKSPVVLTKHYDNSQAVGLAATILTNAKEWAQRLAISPNLHLRSTTQQTGEAREWVTLKAADWKPYYPHNYDGNFLWELKDGWLEHPGGFDGTGHMRIAFPEPEITAFYAIEVEYELDPGASFAVRTYEKEGGDKTFNGRAIQNLTGEVIKDKLIFQTPNSNLATGFYVYSRLIPGGPAKMRIKATPRVRMSGRMLQTNFVRGNDELAPVDEFSMYYARANQGDVSLFGLSEISPVPVKP